MRRPPRVRVDLAAHWVRVRRRYWILFLGHWMALNAVSVWAQVAIEHSRWAFAWPYLLGPLVVLLILVRNRWLQGASLAGLALLYIGQFFGHTLGG